ncbi:hypothetical protein DFQ27_005904 [Actinomortierella ambigua]|uniref:Aminoacyl-transfer RNA synthetases class-II family profile domain-containing protein n=1 Tax=Actinomortierella ambigua TaxID=1343610 RepID=A0A9P6PZ19_9FUNG|nr:hypothetical protein DFQ27_005904 [Actinomortierella ambigua]
MLAMRHLLDLCKRRGFLFQSAEIHGGLRGAYDYGPLGVELKRNIAQEWWASMVYQRSDVVGIDTSIITPPAVLKASGHVDQFTDEMVDSKLSKERFRPDKAPALYLQGKPLSAGNAATTANEPLQDQQIPISAPDKKTAKLWEDEIRSQFAPGALITRTGKQILLHVDQLEKDRIILKKDAHSSVTDPSGLVIPYNGYVDPASNSPFLTRPRPFNLMFKTYLDPIDPIDKVITTTVEATTSAAGSSETRALVDKALYPSLTYLRPETAQGVFINFATVHRSHPHLRVPFGIAQIGKSFRNEIRLEHAIFRTPEFEQMELEYFVAPWQAEHEFEQWKTARMTWWQQYSRHPARFRARAHADDELAHYSRGCVDVEYLFPWGWGEVEGIANRGDFDLRQHSETTGQKLYYTDEMRVMERQRKEKETGTKITEGLDRERFLPHVVESSCGLNRAMLALLLDAMEVIDDKQNKVIPLEQLTEDDKGLLLSKSCRTVLRLHPRLAPIKVAILPLVSNNESLVEVCHKLSRHLKQELNGMNVTIEAQSSTVGKRYYRMDEVGTPWCVTIDFDTLQDRTVTIRERDSGEQRRVHLKDVLPEIQQGLRLHADQTEDLF